nr:metal-dependent transcriptional regulator [Cellulomonas sp. APG4]
MIDTTEMYLRTIYELAEEGIVPLRARIAERLGHSGPTVSQTVARMERDGLVVVSGDRHLELTDAGLLKATRVMRKHRLAERLLTDVIGLEWSFVHDEACRWEHVMSDRVEKRLVELLDHPQHSPYGNPIPGLAELGEEPSSEQFLDGVVSLVVLARAVSAAAPSEAAAVAAGGAVGVSSGEGPVSAVVARLGEPLQTDVELLERLASAGVVPGASIEVERGQGIVTVGAPGAGIVLDLPDEVARHVFVRAEDEGPAVTR